MTVTITGTIANQTTIGEAPTHLFANVTITDDAPGATDTVLIGYEGGGFPTGTLAGDNLQDSWNVVYSLPAGSAAQITSELRSITFTPEAGTTTPFQLYVQSSAATVGPDGSVTSGDAVVTVNVTDRLEFFGRPGAHLYGGSMYGDNFVFQTLHSSPVNHPAVIANFDAVQEMMPGAPASMIPHGLDRIDLHGLDALVVNHHPLVFIGSDSFAHYHAHHRTVFGMVRDSNGLVQVNVDNHLTPDMAISVPHVTLHHSDFIL